MSDNPIVFDNVTYIYGEGTPFRKVALEGASFSLRADATTAIIGHTGSGKSTLAQLMNGLLTPTEGKVYLDGEDIFADKKKLQSVRFRVGLVFQYPEYQLFEETVYKDIAYGPSNMGLPKEEIDRRVRESLRFVGLKSAYLEKSPFELSGGEKRRVAIAGIIAMEPDVLVLDEPAAGLDPMGREEIFGAIRTYQREKHSCVVFISHSMENTARYADDVLVLKSGKIAAHGAVREVFSNRGLIEESHLAVPQITMLIDALRARGLDIRPDIFTLDQAKEALLPLIKGGER